MQNLSGPACKCSDLINIKHEIYLKYNSSNKEKNFLLHRFLPGLKIYLVI